MKSFEEGENMHFDKCLFLQEFWEEDFAYPPREIESLFDLIILVIGIPVWIMRSFIAFLMSVKFEVRIPS